MTLQLRLTIALVAVITTVVTVAGIFAVTSAERELVDGVDDFLVDRAKSIEDFSPMRKLNHSCKEMKGDQSCQNFLQNRMRLHKSWIPKAKLSLHSQSRYP